MEKLRDEILEAEKARSDLLKWKLVLVAAIGTVGLGFGQSEVGHPIVLIGIPLVCAYVDLLCSHLTLRIHVIGNFMRSRTGEPSTSAENNFTQNLFRDYEIFAESNRKAFVFESWALLWSSLLLSAGVLAYGAYLFLSHNEDDATTWALIGAGALGLFLATLVHIVFHARRRTIRHG